MVNIDVLRRPECRRDHGGCYRVGLDGTVAPQAADQEEPDLLCDRGTHNLASTPLASIADKKTWPKNMDSLERDRADRLLHFAFGTQIEVRRLRISTYGRYDKELPSGKRMRACGESNGIIQVDFAELTLRSRFAYGGAERAKNIRSGRKLNCAEIIEVDDALVRFLMPDECVAANERNDASVLLIVEEPLETASAN
jgi:hypothetical protein